MVILLLTFGLIIFGYNYVTDANRVRGMAETYLSRLIGGRVLVHSATLSIFEGMRLEEVRVFVDDGHQPDSLLFSAQSFTLKYDPAKIIRGQLEAAEIIAQKPHVHLTENVDTHQWNFYRLGRQRETKIQPSAPSAAPPPLLPEVLLRNARVEISEVRDGQLRAIGYESMDGHLSPSIELGSFNFEIQTRGIEGIGPWATGTVALGSGRVDAQLHDFDFGRDVRSMLWQDVRDFSERHGLAGRIDLLSVHYQPGRPSGHPVFVTEMRLDNVSFSAQQEDYLSAEDVARRGRILNGLVVMQPFYRLGGFGAVEKAPADAPREESAERKGVLDRLIRGLRPAGSGTPSPEAPAGLSPADSPPAHRRVRSASASVYVPAEPESPADAVALLTETAPIELHHGSGAFIFTDAGVELKDVTGTVEGNDFLINGRMLGYRPNAPFSFSIRSRDHSTLTIPETPRYFNSLPPLVRDIYSIIHPDGHCTMEMKVERPSPGSRPYISGHVDIADGKFACIFFPYALSEARGRVAFGYDEKARADFVKITGIRGRGMPNGPNRDNYVEVEGEVGPLGPEWPDPQVVIRVNAKNVYSEPQLLRALPPEVREPLKIFDAGATGQYPKFHGDFATTVLHRAGWAWRWTFDTDIKLDDASGRLVGFPYPVEHMAADVHVRDGYVDVINAHMTRGDASLRVDGRVTWGPMTPPDAPPSEPKITTDLYVAVKNLPIDKDLLAAIPPDQSIWLKRVGIGGKLDIDGRVFQGLPDPVRPNAPINYDDVKFDLAMGLHGGTLWPADGTFSLSDLSSKVHLTRDAIEFSDMRASRDGADLTGDGAISWGQGPVELGLRVNAKNLAMDSPLYALLPRSGRESWDEVQPRGRLDADMSWRGTFGEKASAPGPAAESIAPSATQKSILPTLASAPVPATMPATSTGAPEILSRIPVGFNAVLKPRGLSCTMKPLPYRLDDIHGQITITPDRVTIAGATARHGPAIISVSGSGTMGDRSEWDLKLAGSKLAIDDEFRKAMPAPLLAMLESVKFRGAVDFDFPRFSYHADETSHNPAATQPATQPAQNILAAAPSAVSSVNPKVDIDMEGTLTLNGCSLEAGVPMKDVFGRLTLGSAVRDGKLSTLHGDLALPRATLAGRNMSDISLQLLKPADRPELALQNIHGKLAGGQVAGEVRLTFPDEGASRYLLSLVVRNANVETLVNDADKDLKGELTASLSLEGTWDDSGPRRGRGDVIVTGKELYHLPLMLGLFQVTNLSLPIATPFKTGTARYSVEGPRVNFERVELKSDSMLMLGAGHLDFKSKQVQMTFTTDNPGGLKVPFLNDLLANARGELLKITIKGTIKEPKVAANPFGTVTTTIDEVFKNDAKTK